MKIKNNQQSGTTIIEVLITIVVIAVGLLAVYGIFAIGLRLTSRTRNTAVAHNYLNSEMEKYRAEYFTDIGLGTSNQSLPNLPNGTVTRDISLYNSDNYLKKITINVSWNDHGTNRTLSESTLITTGGINE